MAQRYWQHRELDERTFEDLVEINAMIDQLEREQEGETIA